ncbi:hypothetical protein [Bradyrhizobium sp. SRS-191]|uniref:hypothetical protein n=1 Tax=Bradyrhizobium sp. SRS-191 TaxID=2962606 RepID=UPI00211DDC4E|nr:hypothetical protein [Bradyrhizobium sp. SRS-191]
MWRKLTRFISRGLFAGLALLVLVIPQRLAAQQVGLDPEAYHRAVDYCRGDVPQPTAISPDRTIVCFADTSGIDPDLSVVSQIAQNGLFVVRGLGGKRDAAMSISDLLRSRNVTVIVFGVCIHHCANYYFVASTRTYVVKNTLVIWQHNLADCQVTFRESYDSKVPKLWRAECPKGDEWRLAFSSDAPGLGRFYQDRVVDRYHFQPLPDSEHVRKRLKSLYDQTGRFPLIGWMLSPASLKRIFQAEIIYESYPQSQEEATALANHYGARDVIYDP